VLDWSRQAYVCAKLFFHLVPKFLLFGINSSTWTLFSGPNSVIIILSIHIVLSYVLNLYHLVSDTPYWVMHICNPSCGIYI